MVAYSLEKKILSSHNRNSETDCICGPVSASAAGESTSLIEDRAREEIFASDYKDPVVIFTSDFRDNSSVGIQDSR